MNKSHEQLVSDAFTSLNEEKLCQVKDLMQQKIIQLPPYFLSTFMEFDIKKELYQNELDKLNKNIKKSDILQFSDLQMKIVLDKKGAIQILEDIETLFIDSLESNFIQIAMKAMDSQESLKATSFYQKMNNKINAQKIKL